MSQIVAIAGCGRMGRQRARSAIDGGAHIGYVYDYDEDRALRLISDYGGQVVATPDELVQEEVDAMFVCTPPSVREELELLAIDAGVSLFLEKPLGVSRDAPARTLRRLDGDPIVTAVGYMNRCRSTLRHVRRLLDGPVTLLGLSLHWVCGRYSVPWWGAAASSGGPVNEQATHFVDLCRFLAGEPTRIRAVGDGHPQDAAAVSMSFASGAQASLLYSCNADEKHIGATVITDAGAFTFSGWEMALTDNSVDDFREPEQPEDVFAVETSQFLEAVRSGDPTAVGCTYADAVRTQFLVGRIIEEFERT